MKSMMKLRSGCHGTPPRSAGSPGGEEDRISALPDDLLLLILIRLGCAPAAARVDLLSRRWRGLWTRLSALVFRDVALPSLEQVLACVISSASFNAVSLLDIRLPKRALPTCSGESQLGDVPSLLRTAARLSPEQLVLALPWGAAPQHSSLELPCFARTTSISLSAASPIVLRPPSDELHALTTLVLTGCAVHELAALVLRCPRLRVLRFVAPSSSFITGHPVHITVHSASLRELVLDEIKRARSIDIAAPMLEQLTVSTRPYGDLSISVMAPKVEKVSWRRHYGGIPLRFGCWTLEAMSLLSTATVVAAHRRRSSSLLRVHVSTDGIPESLSLGNKDYLAREVEKHLQIQVADSSALDLELHLQDSGHVYEALVFFFLKIHPIRTAIHRLKVTLPQPKMTHTDKRGCNEYCRCVPRYWTSQTILLTELEELEIDGFQGADHEFDFLEHLFTCALLLKRVTLKQSSEVVPSSTKHHDFFMAHSRVEFFHVLSSDPAFRAPS